MTVTTGTEKAIMPSIADDMNHPDADKMTKHFRAAYLMVKGSVAEDLVSREELLEALQLAGSRDGLRRRGFVMRNVSGFNPTQKTINRHWPESTRSLTFSQFSNITEIEPIPTQSTLVSLFERLDHKRNGYLCHDEFLLNMTTRADKLPVEVIENLLANEEYNEDNKFYYHKFCEAVTDTKEKVANLAIEKIQKDEEEFSLNSKTYKVKRKTCSPEKGRSVSNSPTKPVTKGSGENWKKTLKSKGCFYFENKNIISHQYVLNVTEKSRHDISVQVVRGGQFCVNAN